MTRSRSSFSARLFSSQSKSRHNKKTARGYQPCFEQLEPRLLLASTTVVGNGGDWHDPSTWSNGVPTLAVDAIVPSGKTVSLAGTNHLAKTLLVQGTAEVVESVVTNKTLSTDWILVDGGAFRVGTAINPYDTNTFTLTLEGDNPTQNLPSQGIFGNDAFLMTRAGGTLDLFGEDETSWSQLGATASVSATSITLKEAVTWDIGDGIVIASTTFDMNEAETRTITSVSGDQKTLGLSSPLTYSHYGQLQFYPDGKGTTYELDERAEVGLLSRNIKIQGDADSTSDGIGGNLMFMNGSGAVHIDGVEFYHMGQKARLARYPLHWHQAGNRAGDYVENTSIHRTFNRALTIHASNNIRVEQTVAYDHIGHGYFLEDAVETGNKFYYNLGLVTREPLPGEELLPTDLGPKQFQISGPGTFWITNPNNELVGNVAGGSQTGSGFWYALPSRGLGGQSVNPRTVALGLFQDNRAHSNSIGLDVDGGPNVFTDVAEQSHYSPPVDANFSGFTAFANDKNGVYFRGTSRLKLPNARLADNFQSTMFAFGQTISDSLIVGVSDNDFGGAKKHGFAVYDGPNIVHNVHFAGFNNPDAGLFSVIGAASREVNHRFDEITFDDPATPLSFPGGVANNTLSRHFGFSLYDVDGTLTGTAGQSIIYDHPIMRSDGDTVLPGWENAAVSQRQFGLLRLSYAGPVPTTTITRTEGPGADASFTDIPQFEAYTQLGVIMNTDFVYTLNYESLTSSTVNIRVTGGVNPGNFVYFRVNAPWATTDVDFVTSTAAKTSKQAVKDSPLSAYYIEPTGTAFIKVVSTGTVRAKSVGSYAYTIADFESGIDSRGSLAASQPGLAGILNWSGLSGESYNYWDVFDNGGADDGFVDFRLTLDQVEDWRGLKDLLISTNNDDNTPVDVFLHDVSAGYTNLGSVPSGDASLDLTGVDLQNRDEIDWLLVRTYETSFTGSSTRIRLEHLGATVVDDVPGDMNGDGTINSEDIAPFLLLVNDPAEYHNQYGSQGEDLTVYRPGTGQWFDSFSVGSPNYLDGAVATVTGSFGSASTTPLVGDVNGDGLDDIVRVDPSGTTFDWTAGHTTDTNNDGASELVANIDSTLNNFGTVPGSEGAFLGDVDGDGTDDAIVINGNFNWVANLSSANGGLGGGGSQSGTQWGLTATNDIPFVGDFNGDGLDDVAVWRPGGGNWYVKKSGPGGLGTGGQVGPGQFGVPTDIPLVGDFNGDSRTDGIIARDPGDGTMQWIAGFANSNGLIDFFNGGGVSNFTTFGLISDTPIVADINGDGFSDIGYIRNVGGSKTWTFTLTSAGGVLGASVNASATFGLTNDVPLTGQFGQIIAASNLGDIDGNGVVDIEDLDDLQAWVDFQAGITVPEPSADFDADGDVDGSDFLAWQRGFGTPGAAKQDGDADDDLDVDADDLSFWQSQFGGSAIAAASATINAIADGPTLVRTALTSEVAPTLADSLINEVPVVALRLGELPWNSSNTTKDMTVDQQTRDSLPEEYDLALGYSLVLGVTGAEEVARIRKVQVAGEHTTTKSSAIDEVFAEWEAGGLAIEIQSQL